ALFYCAFRRERLAPILDIARQSATRPAIFGFRHLHPGSDSVDRFWSVMATFEGNAEAVAWQISRLQEDLTDEQLSIVDVARGEGSMPGPFTGTFSDFIFRSSLVPSAAAAFAEGVVDFDGLQ